MSSAAKEPADHDLRFDQRAVGMPLLEARRIFKSYGHVEALRGVDFAIGAGEVVALVGDNGAGKSTLVKILCGALPCDSGEMFIEGEARVFKSTHDAAREGIAVIYQDLALVDTRDVATNVFLGREPGRLFVSRRVMRRESKRVLRELGISVPSVKTVVSNLSGGQRQLVAIARAALQGGRLMLMDEPTAALGVEGQQRVLRLVAELREQGTATILIAHNLEQVLAVADRIVVLRNGRVAGERAARETNHEDIVHLMLGDRPRILGG